MSTRLIDGVDVQVASPEHLSNYAKVAEQIGELRVPRLYDSSDPDARVFIAMFDGTGNDVVKDPEHITNIGLLKTQVEHIAEKNSNISGFYKEGPGTQGGITGLLDGAAGGTYHERIEAMYEKFNRKSDQWLEENPDAKISVIAVGFSRGAEQAAGFARLVDERGIRDVSAPRVLPQENAFGTQVIYDAPPLRESGTIPQALALYDPVGTGEPSRNDRRPPPSVVTGLQITAGNEHRTLFPSTGIIKQGMSEDGRFIGVTTAGAHSDVGGGYFLNGLSHRNFNLMADYLNRTLGEPMIKPVDVPKEPEKSVIHDSTQHQWFYRKEEEREIIGHLEPSRQKQIEPVNPAIAAQFTGVKTREGDKAAPIPAEPARPIGTPLPERDLLEIQQSLGIAKEKIMLPRSGTDYGGKILYATDTHFIQQAGRHSAVSHEIGKLGNGNELASLYDQGKLDNRMLRFSYGQEKGHGALVPASAQRAESVRVSAMEWANQYIRNPKAQEAFMNRVDRLANGIAPHVPQHAKVLESPAVQPAAPSLQQQVDSGQSR